MPLKWLSAISIRKSQKQLIYLLTLRKSADTMSSCSDSMAPKAELSACGRLYANTVTNL